MEKKKSNESSNRMIWDCGSTLYDSFELKSLQKELDSALVARTLSMPHLSDRRPPPPPENTGSSRRRFFRSFQKLIRAVFRPKGAKKSSYDEKSGNGFYVVYDRAPKMAEIPEYEELSPVLRRSASLGFTCS
ncbi:hypothetical protein SASPL_127383 [Salvia splendens]|uniref:Uncharacterized protein n=1 Tax=Salvia splendens TaxID=180675 RepID=A0A8X8XB19_SALSN|nr:uncharacterized protein LOC121751302 [Salvia splendens]KAG6409344.1 hypothetical protein SASPL_127383 [Salvia splendens]